MSEQINSMILVSKPVGPTSHDIVGMVRKATGVKRVGHAGTLDPFASGLLIMLVGREMTKRQSEFLYMDKTYRATIRLAGTSDTDDRTGMIVPHSTPQPVEALTIHDALKNFIGPQDQTPSQYSAKKISGQPAYKRARRGETVVLSPKRITIHSIDIELYEWPLLTVRMTVSSGTYIRAFARDLGERLGCGGYVQELERTSIGPYSLQDAIAVEELQNPESDLVDRRDLIHLD